MRKLYKVRKKKPAPKCPKCDATMMTYHPRDERGRILPHAWRCVRCLEKAGG